MASLSSAIALYRLAGVSQTTPSTPGVFPPVFVATRLTAMDLAAIEDTISLWSR